MNLPNFASRSRLSGVSLKSGIICALAILVLCGGCSAVPKSMTALVKELAKDPATAYVRIPTPYGVFEFVRTNPGSNTVPHVVSRDGSITVGIPK